MRFNYKDLQIEYVDNTGDTAVYKNDRMVMHACMSKWLATKEVVDNVSYLMKMPGLPGRDKPYYGIDFIYNGDEAC